MGVEEASITAIQKTLNELPMTTFIKHVFIYAPPPKKKTPYPDIHPNNRYGNSPPLSVQTVSSYSLSFFHQSVYVAGIILFFRTIDK
jgi:hypothetical protein